MKFLVKFDCNWADEFDVSAFRIVDDMDAVQAIIAGAAEGYWFGTNEGWEAGEITEDDFEIVEITDEEAEVLVKLFGSSYGNFPY